MVQEDDRWMAWRRQAVTQAKKGMARETSDALANRIVCKATEKGAFIKNNS